MSATPSSAFRLSPMLSQVVPDPVATLLAPPLEFVLSLRRLERFYGGMPQTHGALQFANTALSMLGVRFDPRGALAAVPDSGPLVVVANHPFGGVEGLSLYALLAERRPDVRVLGNQLLGRLVEFAPVIFPVDILGGRGAAVRNGRALRAAIRHVSDGGVLLVFPSGEVASYDPVSRVIVDPPWQSSVGRLIQLTGAPVVPMYIDGGNSPLFHAAGLIHPRLRTALLPREMFNKSGRRIPVTVGALVPAARLAAIDGDGPRIEHLRLCTYALACAEGENDQRPRVGSPRESVRPVEALPEPIAVATLAREIASLPAASRLDVSGDLEVWHINASAAPWVMQEIGRLRELTFRGVGEGTGHARDIDLYDSYYEQLVLWNRAKGEIVGGYRLGAVDRILDRFGARGLYTSTLFRYHKSLLPSLGPALELGRSFVQPNYQRSYAPLLMLWKGIAAYLVRNPRYRTLFGPVSISADYSPASSALLTGFLQSRYRDPSRSRLVRPRQPLPVGAGARLLRREGAEIESLESLEAAMVACDASGRGVPVLLRQYLKLGARVMAFNRDPAFSDSIDVLAVVDLLRTDRKALQKYMGRDGMDKYLRAHSLIDRDTG